MKNVVVLWFFSLWFFPAFVFGESKIEVFIQEYTYKLDKEDSKKSVRNKAEEQLRTILLKKIESFVEANYSSVTTIDNLDIKLNYEEAVNISTHRKVAMKILEEKFINNGDEYWVKAEMTVDVGAINAYLERKQAEIEEAERKKRFEAEEAERKKQAETEEAERKKRQNEQNIAVLKTQIDAAQKQVDILGEKEAEALRKRNSAKAEFERAGSELNEADKEYKMALSFLNSNPSSQSARKMVDAAKKILHLYFTKYCILNYS